MTLWTRFRASIHSARAPRGERMRMVLRYFSLQQLQQFAAQAWDLLVMATLTYGYKLQFWNQPPQHPVKGMTGCWDALDEELTLTLTLLAKSTFAWSSRCHDSVSSHWPHGRTALCSISKGDCNHRCLYFTMRYGMVKQDGPWAWSVEDWHSYITVLELWAVHLALKYFLPYLRGKHVLEWLNMFII